MKKRIIYAAALLMAGSVVSCDDFFETTSNSSYVAEDVFEDVVTARMAVLGIYNTVSNTWSKRVSQYFPFDDDLCVVNVENSMNNNEVGLGRYNITAGNGELTNWHRAMYQGVGRANICIQNIEASPLLKNGTAAEIAEMKRLLGESYTMRAVMMSEIVKIWGDVPFSTKPAEAGDDFELPATDRDTIYGTLIADLIKAIDLVPWWNEVTLDERVTKGAVLAYIGRLCLLRGGYSLRSDGSPAALGEMKRPADYKYYYKLAQQYLGDLINSGKHRLNPSFEQVFRNMCELKLDGEYGENLLEIAWGGGSSAISGEVGSYMGPKISENSKYGKCTGGINITPTYYFLFDRQYDTRFPVCVAPYEIDKDNNKLHRKLTTMYPGKIRRDWRVPLMPGTGKYTDINWPLMRYSDVLLMFAEVENELNDGPTQAAIDAYEAVRKRAYAGNENRIGETPVTKDAFFEAIVKERALELASEGVRKYDLIRWNRLNEALKQVKSDAQRLAADTSVPEYVWYRFENDVLEIVFIDPQNDSWTRQEWRAAIDDSYLNNLATNYFKHGQSELYPFGTATLSVNPKLYNNYGY